MRFKLAFLFALPLRYLSALLFTLLFATSAAAQNYSVQPPPPSWGPVWTIPQPQPPQPQPQYQAPVQQEPVRDDAIVVDMTDGSAAPTALEPQAATPQFSVPPQYQAAPSPSPTQTRPSYSNSEAAAVHAPSQNPAPSQTRTASQMALNSRGLSSAVSCAAALQIAALAAPGWSSEHGVAEATNLWLERVFTEADKAAVSGDRVNALVKEEMEKQTSASVNDPNIISRKAFDCATRRPA